MYASAEVFFTIRLVSEDAPSLLVPFPRLLVLVFQWVRMVKFTVVVQLEATYYF